MTRSDTIAQLAAALSKAQGAIKAAAKDNTNPHFKSKYADLASVWDACREPLAKNELAVIQLPSVSDGQVHVVTLLTHSSGEWISETLDFSLASDTPQAIGSTITYGRRYGLSAMVGVAPDDDDDGEATRQADARANGGQQARPQMRPPQAKASSGPVPITPAQKQELVDAAKAANWNGPALQAFITKKYGGWSKIPAAEFSAVMLVMQHGTDVEAQEPDASEPDTLGAPAEVNDDDIPF